ncbi:MAG TPA: hypothetical protein VEQ87_18040 [Burkholderiales bacterium]|nr:hypothetical protein [Burkholderiales bacterium]
MSYQFAAAVFASLLCLAACSKEGGEASFVSEAHAASFNQKDYGWQTTPDFPTKPQDVHEYH